MLNKCWLILVVCCCLPAWGAPSLPHAAAQARQAAQLLSRAAQHPAGSRELVNQAAEQVPDACPSLKAAAEQPTPEHVALARREVAAYQRALALGASAGAQPATQSPHAVLHAVLERGEFQVLNKVTTPIWMRWVGDRWAWVWHQMNRGFDAFGNTIKRILSRFRPPHWDNRPGWLDALSHAMPKLSQGMLYTLWGILGVALLFLLGLLGYRLLVRKLKRSTTEVRSELLDGNAPVSRKQEPSFWERSLQDAETFWQQGDQRKALRTIYWACLVLLDTRGVMHFDEGRANGEILRELRRRGFTGVYEQFRPISRCFDRSWYGFLNISREEFTQVLENTRQFRGTVVGEP